MDGTVEHFPGDANARLIKSFSLLLSRKVTSVLAVAVAVADSPNTVVATLPSLSLLLLLLYDLTAVFLLNSGLYASRQFRLLISEGRA